LLCFFCLALVLERYPFRRGPFHGDICAYALIGHEMLAGRKLYSDLWDHKPPLHYATYAAAEKLVGYGWGEIFLLNVLGAAATLLGVYSAGRACGAGRGGGLLAAGLWTLLSADLPMMGNQPNAELFINAFMTAA